MHICVRVDEWSLFHLKLRSNIFVEIFGQEVFLSSTTVKCGKFCSYTDQLITDQLQSFITSNSNEDAVFSRRKQE